MNHTYTEHEKQRFNAYRQSITENGKLLYAGLLLQRSAKKFPNRIALICDDTQITYKQLYYYACRLSEKVRAAGVRKGDRVVLLFENSLAFYVAYFAVWQSGAVVTPLNIFLQEKEVTYIVADAQPSLILCSEKKKHLFTGDNLPEVITDGEIDLASDVPEELPSYTAVEQDEHELAALLYTSGTTGFPKGVMLSSKNIMTNLLQGMARIKFDFQQRVFGVLPLFHSFAQNVCVWASLFVGCTVILVRRIDRRNILAGLRHKPTIFLGVPALYGLLCLLRTAPLDSVEYFVSGGDALPDRIRAAFELIYRRKICNGYGLTETSPLISVDFDDVAEPTNSVGRPVIGMDVSLRNDDGVEVAQGEIGTLWVRGDNIMMGYYNAPEMTTEVLRDGWFCTGDFVKINKNGKLLICGRNKDLIIHKGFNIYPQEIENVIMGHSSVLRVGVIGKKDESYGEIPVAYIQLRTELADPESVIRRLCNNNLAAYKVPRVFVFVKNLAITATGKVDKKKLRAQQG